MPDLIKVAIVGPESTGKTSLSKSLAEHFGTNWVPEFARDYLKQRGPIYTAKDVEYIAQQQIKTEDEYAGKTKRILICDTNLFVIKIWMEHAYNFCPDWIIEAIETRHYDLHLLTGIDFPWEDDPLREHPHLREHFYDLYRNELINYNTNFVEITGAFQERLSSAIEEIQKLFN